MSAKLHYKFEIENGHESNLSLLSEQTIKSNDVQLTA